jgi:hypothetical protein
LAVPLNHFTYGFYNIHQVVELLERNSESKGTEAQPQHTFSNSSHSLSFNKALYRRNIFTFPKKKRKKKKREQKIEYQKQSSLQSVLVLFGAGMLCMLGSDGKRARQSENGKRARQRERKKSERERARKECVRERERRSLPHGFKKVRIEEGRACFTENRSVKQAQKNKTNSFLVFC